MWIQRSQKTLRHLRLMLKDGVLSLRWLFSPFLSWLYRPVTVITEKDINDLLSSNIILTLIFLDTVFPVYLLSWTFVSFFSFSLSIYFWSSSLLAVSIFSGPEMNRSIASIIHTDYAQPLLASCCLIICFSGFWQVLLFVDFQNLYGYSRVTWGECIFWSSDTCLCKCSTWLCRFMTFRTGAHHSRGGKMWFYYKTNCSKNLEVAHRYFILTDFYVTVVAYFGDQLIHFVLQLWEKK